MYGCFVRLRSATEGLFQLLQQFAERTPTHVQQFAVGVDRRHALNLQCIHFLLIEGAVHHLMSDLRIQECDDVQGLYYVRTVGAGQ